MYQIIIEHCFFGNGKFYDATIKTCSTEQLAELERTSFLFANPSYQNHSVIIKEIKQ